MPQDVAIILKNAYKLKKGYMLINFKKKLYKNKQWRQYWFI